MTETLKRSANMKRTLKRIFPILLAIVVIFSILWYLFIYDQDFTQDLLIWNARYFEKNGKHTVAAWFYQQAYLQAEDNEQAAIELAEQFKADGNYTKAEYTLSNAIADSGSINLYIALCKTYVEQDKLLDAVTMLDHITDPEIEAQLNALRPAAPAVNQAPGFYNQYITVTLEATGGTLCFSTSGEYPSLESNPTDSSVSLERGENTIYALCIGDNGLVSPLGIYGYTVGNVVEEVTLADKTLDSIIRQQLGIDAGATLYSTDLWEITSLFIPEGADSYEDLSYLPYLESLTIENSYGSGLEAIGSLSQLTTLVIQNSLVSSDVLKAIASAPKLENLTLSDCDLSNIENLSGAKELSWLDLSNNAIRDVSALSFMSDLVYLNLSHNALTSLNALSSLTSLETLDVSYNSLSSITPLSSCTQLQMLNINNNTVANLNGVNYLTNLADLFAAFNTLTDISQLTACTELVNLDLSSNALTDITCLSALTNLQTFAFSRNQVTALPAWSKDCSLVFLDGSYNALSTISGLAGLQKLNTVLMDYNAITTVKALATCRNLVKLSIYGNTVSDTGSLTEIGVIVTPASLS